MDTNALKKFAQAARNLLIDQVTSKLDLVLAEGSPARREHPKAIKDLDSAIARDGKRQVIEQVAYTWFNRFSALRFMDACGYTQVGVVSPAEGQTRPELLSEAMAGNLPEGAPGQVAALLNGRTPSDNPQAEAYRLLLVHACNQWHGPMPFLFEEIDDYTELLMPEDLLSQTSILAELRKVMTADACQDVEIIGWLYQFYISEKKDQVIAGLKKNQKITAENIPAATQLFTPHWIVRYLVENSLGRLWLLNRPDSRLAERMDYYIATEEPETDFLKIGKPEEIKICDPACGSGHMLTYAFDLLCAIYEEEGYDATEIPALILTHNLTGVEIDDRAGALAAFALAMKAAAKLGRRRFLRMEVQPNICVLQNVSFTPAEMQDVAAVVGKDLFTDELRETLVQFEQAKNFGSLIVPKLRDPAETLPVVEASVSGADLVVKPVLDRVVAVLRMTAALSPKYHIVVANPPYIAASGMNGQLSQWLKDHYAELRSDQFAAFIYRNTKIALDGGYLGFMTPFVWMFNSSHESLRNYILNNTTITSLVQPEYNAFWNSAHVAICMFSLKNSREEGFSGTFIDLTAFPSADEQSAKALEAIHNIDCEWRFCASASDFDKIPRRPIVFGVSQNTYVAFDVGTPLEEGFKPVQGLITGDMEKFSRLWHEVGSERFCRDASDREVANKSGCKWFPYNKGGRFRKWAGNHDYVVDWENDGRSLKSFVDRNGKLRSRPQNQNTYFKCGLTWTAISSAFFAVRYSKEGSIGSNAGMMIFSEDDSQLYPLLGFLNSNTAEYFLSCLSQTLNFDQGNIARLPLLSLNSIKSPVKKILAYSEADWDSYESSWNFTTLPLLSPDHRGETLADSYATLRAHWQSMTDEMKALEEENNRIFIDAYGLQDELTPEVPIEEITLTCNPAYSIKGDMAEEVREAKLRTRTVEQFLSYAVGCMFGRYSLDAPGLILANQGEQFEDYLARIPEPSFIPDEDNVIPMLDADWFPDDITERFRLFLRVTFGETHFRENLRYIEDALGKDIRKYFTKDFYADHVKRYKKRPIYWMFSSPKGTFNALIYMHRYRADTVSVLLNDYLREFITKLEAERVRLEKLSDDESATQAQRTKALKDAAKVATQIEELTAWERDVVFPLAQQKIEIDLDNGVKHNYPQFGSALKKIPGLEAKDD